MTEDRSPQGRGPQHTTHFDDCGCKTARLEARVAELEKENAIIRGLLVKHECPYGEKSLGECSRGFPGCACADDMLATASWCPEDEDKATVRLGRRVAELEAELADARETATSGDPAFREAYAEACASNVALREALERVKRFLLAEYGYSGGEALFRGEVIEAGARPLWEGVCDALAAHPAASLAAYRKSVLEEAAIICESRDCRGCADNIRNPYPHGIPRALAAQAQAATHSELEVKP